MTDDEKRGPGRPPGVKLDTTIKALVASEDRERYDAARNPGEGLGEFIRTACDALADRRTRAARRAKAPRP